MKFYEVHSERPFYMELVDYMTSGPIVAAILEKENASYGLTLCAECGLVSSLINSGGGRLIAFTCVDISGNLLMPCGRCRQLLQEHGGSKLQLATDDGIKTLADLLPWAFGPEEMEKRLD